MTKLRLKVRKTLVPAEVGPGFACPQGPCWEEGSPRVCQGLLGTASADPGGGLHEQAEQVSLLFCSVGMGPEASLRGWPWAQGSVTARSTVTPAPSHPGLGAEPRSSCEVPGQAAVTGAQAQPGAGTAAAVCGTPAVSKRVCWRSVPSWVQRGWVLGEGTTSVSHNLFVSAAGGSSQLRAEDGDACPWAADTIRGPLVYCCPHPGSKPKNTASSLVISITGTVSNL